MDMDIIQLFIDGAKKAYREVENHSFIFPIAIDSAYRLATSIEKRLKEQEWHMLTEDDDGVIHGFPGDDGQYLMTDGEDIWIDNYVDGVADGIILDSGRDIREITAWMYMPEFPKKGDEQDGRPEA